MTVASKAAASAVKSLRSQPWGLAVAVISEGMTEFALDGGADELDVDSYFELGSVTKTMTGLLVADCVVRGEASLDTTIAEILGDDAGNCGRVKLLDLATHRSGIPQAPPREFLDRTKVDRLDPFVSFREADLLEALRLFDAPTPPFTFVYSNLGFMLLGFLLGRITKTPYVDLIRERIFAPLGMTSTVCGVAPAEARLPGYEGPLQTGWRSHPLPGAGGVGSNIRDLARYVAACISPPPSMAAAFELALKVHAPNRGLGWVHRDGIHWHNGGTSGFRSFVAFHSPARSGIALLANSVGVDLDSTGFAVMAELAGNGTPGTS